MRQEIEAYQHDYEKEMEEKEKKIAALENEKLLIARQNENNVDRLTNELEEVKEQVVYLKRNEAVIDVYKRKVEQMADLKAELTDQQELNQRLQVDIQEMQRNQDQDRMLEDVVTRVQHELQQCKVKADMKDLEL